MPILNKYLEMKRIGSGLAIIIALAFSIGCNATKDMPHIKITEGHDAQMGGGTGTGTIGDDPTQPRVDNP